MLKTSKQDRESLIDQLINESKKRKAERQRNKEETLEATEQLDEEWKSLGVIVTSTKDTEEVNNQKKDQYDIVMRQLKFEPHGQVSLKLNTVFDSIDYKLNSVKYTFQYLTKNCRYFVIQDFSRTRFGKKNLHTVLLSSNVLCLLYGRVLITKSFVT